MISLILENYLLNAIFFSARAVSRFSHSACTNNDIVVAVYQCQICVEGLKTNTQKVCYN